MNKMKNMYQKHVQDTAPDMDRLWARIEQNIDNKTDKANITSTIKQTKRSYGKYIVAVASLLIVVSTASIFSIISKNDSFDKATTNSNSFETFENINENYDSVDGQKIVSYESLSFGGTDTKNYNADYTSTGDEYFVEENVLDKTEFFADVVVTKSALYSTYAQYDLQINALITKTGEINETDITITSTTPYVLQENREYFIPLYEENGKYYISLENAPQIEISLSGEVVFQNGWESLDENSCYVEKSQTNSDDFYYDRMRYSYEEDLQKLIKKWKSL